MQLCAYTQLPRQDNQLVLTLFYSEGKDDEYSPRGRGVVAHSGVKKGEKPGYNQGKGREGSDKRDSSKSGQKKDCNKDSKRSSTKS